MDNRIIPLLLISVVIFVSGCTQAGLSSNQPTCNSPYILVGNECCLDQNGNNVCDSDETPTQQANLCQGVTCPDYCEGIKRYYYGQCFNGECSYASTECNRFKQPF